MTRQRGRAYLGEKVVREKEYRSAMVYVECGAGEWTQEEERGRREREMERVCVR